MGANPTQAYGFIVFFLSFVALAGAFASEGNIMLVVVATLLLGVSVAISLKC